MSSVFLADVDDYLSPSMACVNPAFFASSDGNNNSSSSDGAATAAASTIKTTEPVVIHAPSDGKRDEDASGEGVVAVVGRRPRRPRRSTSRLVDGGDRAAMNEKDYDNNNNNNNTTTDNNSTTKKVTASIVDCLACSGCVTTAETVLLKEHSLDKFRRLVVEARRTTAAVAETTTDDSTSFRDEDEDSSGSSMVIDQEGDGNIEHDGSTPRIVVTLSIASAAELLRLLVLNDSVDDDQQLELLHRKLVAMLCQRLHVDAVLDGRLALEWSLQQSALEFCDRYRAQEVEVHPQQFKSSVPATVFETAPVTHPISTVLSSSCPATVCYVEKTCPTAVPHLSNVVSPMGCARVYLSHTSIDKPIRHVAIMPCHDKKLEASRPLVATPSDLAGGGNDATKDVLVLTTADAYQLLLESIVIGNSTGCDDRFIETTGTKERLRALFEAMSPAPLDRVASTREFEPRRTDIVPHSWITTTIETHGAPGAALPDHSNRHRNGNDQLLYTSGGYADYIFRFAAKQLFGVSISRVEWCPMTASVVVSGSKASEGGRSRPASARVASARREILEATLYRHVYHRLSPPQNKNHSGSGADSVVYCCDDHLAPKTFGDDGSGPLALVSSTPVLRFAIAHGLQVMQRAIASAGSNQGGRYHYVEAMACPSGCLNGGGQVLPLAADPCGISRREAPSEVRARVALASRNLLLPLRPALIQESSTMEEDVCSHERRCEQLVTTFQAVQSLHLQYGAAKGMAVKDMQW